MRIVGYRKADFVAKDGTAVMGYNVYLVTEIDPRYGNGIMAERVYLSAAKLARDGIDLEKVINHEVKIYYNRYGKVDSIAVQD